jgi:hypothetical protein
MEVSLFIVLPYIVQSLYVLVLMRRSGNPTTGMLRGLTQAIS